MAVFGDEGGELLSEVGRSVDVGDPIEQTDDPFVEGSHQLGRLADGLGDLVQRLGVLGRMHIARCADQMGDKPRLAGGGSGVGEDARHDRRKGGGDHVVAEDSPEAGREVVEIGEQFFVGRVERRFARIGFLDRAIAVLRNLGQLVGPQSLQHRTQDLQ